MEAGDWAHTLDFNDIANWTLLECLWCIKLGDGAIRRVQNTQNVVPHVTPGMIRETALDRVFFLLFGGVPADPYADRNLGPRAPYNVVNLDAVAQALMTVQNVLQATAAPLLGPPAAAPVNVQGHSGAVLTAGAQAAATQATASLSPAKAQLTRGFADVGVAAAPAAAPAGGAPAGGAPAGGAAPAAAPAGAGPAAAPAGGAGPAGPACGAAPAAALGGALPSHGNDGDVSEEDPTATVTGTASEKETKN
jgi:hypothetical protein